MTCLEKLKQEHPGWHENEIRDVVNDGCPSGYGYLDDPRKDDGTCACINTDCNDCWNREIPGTDPIPKEHGINTIKVMLDPGAKMPTLAHDTDAGFDLYSREEKFIPALGSAIFDTGVHVAIPKNYCGVLISKSGLNTKRGLTSTGLIDSGYTGSIAVKLYNQSPKAALIAKGEKISQLVIMPIITPELEQVDSLEATDRGDNGFGSSGKF